MEGVCRCNPKENSLFGAEGAAAERHLGYERGVRPCAPPVAAAPAAAVVKKTSKFAGDLSALTRFVDNSFNKFTKFLACQIVWTSKWISIRLVNITIIRAGIRVEDANGAG